MFNSSRLAFAWILLSLSSSVAMAQSGSNVIADEEIRRRLEEIEKDISEINQLLKLRAGEPERLTWDRLGVTGKAINGEALPEQYKGGVEITKVEPNSAAEALALKIGDVVVQYDGAKTPTLEDLVGAVERSNSRGMRLPEILVIRDGKVFVTSRSMPVRSERNELPMWMSNHR